MAADEVSPRAYAPILSSGTVTPVFSFLLLVIGHAESNHSLNKQPGQWLVRAVYQSLGLWGYPSQLGQLLGQNGLW